MFLAILCLVIPMLALIFVIFYKKLLLKERVCILIVALVVSSAVWVKISYNSYYDGLAAQIISHNYLLLNMAQDIFNAAETVDEALEIFTEVASLSASNIKIINENNSQEWLIKEAILYKDYDKRVTEKDEGNSRPIDTKHGKFNFEFTYSVRPFWSVALRRALTNSLYDIVTEDGYENQSLAEIIGSWWKSYSAYNYRRSINLWVYFFFIFITTYAVWCRLKELYEERKILKKDKEDLTQKLTEQTKLIDDLIEKHKTELDEYLALADAEIEEKKLEIEELKELKGQEINELTDKIRALEQLQEKVNKQMEQTVPAIYKDAIEVIFNKLNFSVARGTFSRLYTHANDRTYDLLKLIESGNDENTNIDKKKIQSTLSKFKEYNNANVKLYRYRTAYKSVGTRTGRLVVAFDNTSDTNPTIVYVDPVHDYDK